MSANKNVVFDVVGTLISYDRIYNAIDTRLGPKLREHNVQPSFLGYTWVEVAEREYTYLSVSGAYTPYATHLRKDISPHALPSRHCGPRICRHRRGPRVYHAGIRESRPSPWSAGMRTETPGRRVYGLGAHGG